MTYLARMKQKRTKLKQALQRPLRPLRLNRKKADPSQFVFTGTKPDEEVSMHLFKYNKETYTETPDIALEDIESFDQEGHYYWLNVHGLHEPDIIASICRRLKVHNLVIQDLLDVNQRPKFQVFEDFSLLIIKSTVPTDEGVLMEQIGFIFGERFLVSFQERKGDHFEHLRLRIREGRGIIRERGSDFLLYTMIEAILDNYFKTLEEIDQEVASIDFVNADSDPEPALLGKIEANKRFVHLIKKAILPVKEFTLMVEREASPFIEARHLKYFYEIKDLCLTLLDTCEAISASLEGSTNLFFYVQGHRMNQVMKTLTVVATIFIPLTFIAGIYGMNFEYMPELSWQHGYAAVWALMVLIVGAMVIYIRQRRWF